MLTKPAEAAMTELLGFLEPWCDGEEVLEDGSTFEEEKERQEIYAHHLATQAVLAAATEAAAAAADAATAAVAAVPAAVAAAAAAAAATATATAALVPAGAYAAPPSAGDPAVEAHAPFDVLAHFLAD